MSYQTYQDQREAYERDAAYMRNMARGWKDREDRKEAFEAAMVTVAELEQKVVDLNISYYGVGILY